MSPKVSSVKTYIWVFAGLVALTFLTVMTAAIDLGTYNIVITIVIAGIKTSLVLLFFMHVLHSTNWVKIFAGTGFLWLALLVGILMSDYMTRHWDYREKTPSWITEEASHYLTPKDAGVKGYRTQ